MPLPREIQLTADGFHTISVPDMNATYHSHHGAEGESMHVYIEAGLGYLLQEPRTGPLHIFEMGFGTGLNALLSLREAITRQQPIVYTAIELFPLTKEEYTNINYGEKLGMPEAFLQLHAADWERPVVVHPFFTLEKKQADLGDITSLQNIDCIFFDAFSPVIQPGLWTEAIFQKMYHCLKPGGVLVTYSSKSVVRKAMTAAGFTVEKIPGPWGKREMVRAGK